VLCVECEKAKSHKYPKRKRKQRSDIKILHKNKFYNETDGDEKGKKFGCNRYYSGKKNSVFKILNLIIATKRRIVSIIPVVFVMKRASIGCDVHMTNSSQRFLPN
jgi:hypothetical protein